MSVLAGGGGGLAMADGYYELAARLEDAIDQVTRAKNVRDRENIEQFGDLDLILAELRQMHRRASTTRFK
jgi:hypothetical protein